MKEYDYVPVGTECIYNGYPVVRRYDYASIIIRWWDSVESDPNYLPSESETVQYYGSQHLRAGTIYDSVMGGR